MKKLIMSLLIMMLYHPGRAQVPVPTVVSDFVAHAHLIEAVNTSKETISAVNKQLEILEEKRDFITTVSNSVRQLRLFESVVRNQKLAIQNSGRYYDYLHKSEVFTPHEMTVILYNFSRVIQATERSLALANSILKDGFFKMSDAERIDFLKKTNSEILEKRRDLDRLYRDYQEVAEKRVVLRVFGG